MTTLKKDDIHVADLADENLVQQTSDYSYRELVTRGVVVDVTRWLQTEMGFAEYHFQVDVAVTAKLWKTIVTISPVSKAWQTMESRGCDLLLLAFHSLQHARLVGQSHALFSCFLPTDDDADDFVHRLRAERSVDGGHRAIVIGFADEFPLG